MVHMVRDVPFLTCRKINPGCHFGMIVNFGVRFAKGFLGVSNLKAVEAFP